MLDKCSLPPNMEGSEKRTQNERLSTTLSGGCIQNPSLGRVDDLDGMFGNTKLIACMRTSRATSPPHISSCSRVSVSAVHLDISVFQQEPAYRRVDRDHRKNTISRSLNGEPHHRLRSGTGIRNKSLIGSLIGGGRVRGPIISLWINASRVTRLRISWGPGSGIWRLVESSLSKRRFVERRLSMWNSTNKRSGRLVPCTIQRAHTYIYGA
ncbi:hypothetical protein NEOLEDRAFT_722415 [Neolentinus lepideus HHB14362 ss-1]|uniref:Uncharacterized protein n=1 Tax=Neolentinus lepideus HHB14362 ss-1 TaxID=1314782 RepID=A0A165Q2N0_9AGAM|nr:hypothetical protein NEOLEDRAFT_722415 [Neolentinus lepideus HHB14362 ss-1]